MKLKYKTRKTLSQILSIVLVCALGLGAIFGVSALSKKLKEEMKEIHPTYHLGGINASGAPINDEYSMYSDAFECSGLTITPKFDSQVQYKVAFYNTYGEFISMTTNSTEPTTYDVPQFATHARIIITPKSTYEDDDDRLGLMDRIKLSDDITVEVFKKQLAYEKIDFTIDDECKGIYFSHNQTEGSPLVYDLVKEGYGVSEVIEVKDATSIVIKSNTPNQTWRIAFLDSSENVVEVDYLKYTGEGIATFDIPNNVHYVRFALDMSATYDIWLTK